MRFNIDPYLWPAGLCADRADHYPHMVWEGSLAPFWCTSEQEQREPGRSQRRQDQQRSESLSEG